jgi:hypothetical protein
MGGACSAYGEKTGVYRVVVGKPEGERPLGKPEGERPLGKPRRRWEDNIMMDFQEVGC